MDKSEVSVPSGRRGLILIASSVILLAMLSIAGRSLFSGGKAEAQQTRPPVAPAAESKLKESERISKPEEMQLLAVTNEEENQKLEDRWGIRIENLMLTSAGHMLDFRYRVMDPEKALPLFDPATKPYLVDQATGNKCVVPKPPKVGSLRQVTRTPEAGRIYYMIFANPARMIARGNQVTVVIGDFRAENLTVQ